MTIARPTSTSSSPALVERDEPLAALARHLDEAAAGSGRFVVIRGEAGIGKTALLRSFLLSRPPDVTLLAGACDGVSTPQPFGPLEDMVARLGPELRALLDSNASRAEVGRWLLGRLSTGEKHVVAIEDLQWADEATLEVLAYLARRLDTLPLLIIVTYRDGDDASPSLARILGSIATLPVVLQLPLEPLSRAGVGRLAEGGNVDVDELHRISGGNPFYVKEVLDTGGDGIPVSVLDAVRARVALLDERGRRALQAVAIIGTRAEPWLLAAIAGEDLIGIDDGLRVGLLAKADGIAFRHELTRMAVLEDLPVIHGIALHRRALAALELAGATDSARLAYHAEGAADRDAVLRHASAAGKRALTAGALHEAEVQFRRALRYADGIGGAARAELLESLALVLHLLNEITDSYEASREAVALWRATGDNQRLARNLTFMSQAAWLDRHGDEAWEVAREAVAILEPLGDSRALGMAHAALGRMAINAGTESGGRADNERALEVGRRLGDPETIATALTSMGTVEWLRGNSAGRGMLEEALRIAREAHLPFAIDRAINNLGATALVWREFKDAERWFTEMAAFSERSEIERCSVYTPYAEIALATGDWDRAESNARAAFVAPRTDPGDRVAAMLVLARLSIRRGDGGEDGWLAESTAAAFAMGSTQIRWPLAATLGERAWLTGVPRSTPSEVREAYVEACAHGDSWAIGELGAWLWRNGELSSIDERAALPYRLEVDGRLREAADEWLRLGVPYEAALALVGSSDPVDVRRAHTMLVGLGATAVAHKVALRLRELGTPVPRGPRSTTRANPGGLTEREAEIARLLAEGRSNAEIAGTLVLSTRTVGHHVSAVLGKLGVHRRAEVAAALRESGASI